MLQNPSVSLFVSTCKLHHSQMRNDFDFFSFLDFQSVRSFTAAAKPHQLLSRVANNPQGDGLAAGGYFAAD